MQTGFVLVPGRPVLTKIFLPAPSLSLSPASQFPAPSSPLYLDFKPFLRTGSSPQPEVPRGAAGEGRAQGSAGQGEADAGAAHTASSRCFCTPD